MVKPTFERGVSKGGIILPDRKDEPEEGVVALVASDSSTVKVGQHVLYPRYTGWSYEIDREKFLIFNQEELICIFDS